MPDKLKYTKTKEDISREAVDLRDNQTIKFMKHQEAFKFNVGDIVVMQYTYGDGKWNSRTNGANKVPVKYMYVFENEIGIGYIKQLKADGSGFTTLTTCVADLDPNSTRLILDPDFVDHLLLSDAGEEFDYSKMHTDRASFRKAAIEKNKKLLVDLSTPELRLSWFKSLKVGDAMWISNYSWDDVVERPGMITDLLLKKNPADDSVVLVKIKGYDREYKLGHLLGFKVLKSKPWPLKDDSI